MTNYLKFLFSGNNLTQASTIKAIIGFLTATGLVVMSPDQQEQAASLALRLIGSLMNLLAAAQASYAFVNFLYNERKHTIITTAPVTITTPTIIEPKG